MGRTVSCCLSPAVKGAENMKKKGIMYRSPLERFFYGLNIFLLILLSLSIILPFLHILALSFNGGKDAMRGGVYFWPRVFSLENYKEVFSDNRIINGYKITLGRTIIGTTLSVFLTAMAAYALKRKTLPGRSFFTFLIFFTMLFSGGMIPYYMVLRNLGLLNSFWIYVIPGLYSSWNIIVMRTFFETIDIGLEESAKLDGCGELRIFLQIILPLSKPVIAVIALFVGVGHWNDWFTGAYYVKKRELFPVQTVLREMLTTQERLKSLMSTSYETAIAARRQVTGESLKMATIIVSVVPIVCVYPFIQKYFTKGVMIGAIKG